MPEQGSVLVVGGTAGIGLEVARHYAGTGARVAISGRDQARAENAAKEIGPDVRGIGFDLAEPTTIGAALSDLDRVDRLVLAAIERDENRAADFDVARALRLVTLKLVGYLEVVHALLPRMPEDASVVVFGGQAKERPYPGSTTVSTVNGGIVGLVHSLAVEIAPRRVNGLHPGIVGDSPYWREKTAALAGVQSRTPTARVTEMGDIVDATVFLLGNRGVNGQNLAVDGGWLLL